MLFLAALPAGEILGSRESDDPPRGPFGLSMVSTVSGRAANIHEFLGNRRCAVCHETQWEEMNGSMHPVAHRDPLYRRYAELAREEAGEEVYAYCSGCHSPAGVVSGLIPSVHDSQLPELAREGVSCDLCHQVIELSGAGGPWGEPANASLVLEPGDYRKFGPGEARARNMIHESVERSFFTRSEYCASCHTVIHPFNGLRLEHTYDEWKRSIYAEKGIQCQDCHMRTVEDAILVARTLEPREKEIGKWAVDGEPRPISRHFFVGGNADAHLLGGDRAHSDLAIARLRSAATLEIELREADPVAGSLAFDVVVTNVGAGHALPTSLIELRQMWVHLRVTTASGILLHESGGLDDEGGIRPGAIRFGAHTIDAAGEITHRPWEAVDFAWKRLVPPRGSARDEVDVPLPSGVMEPVVIEARLLYRGAPPHVVEMVMKEEAYVPGIVEMAAARTTVSR